jgi:hypothetical protein
VLVCRWRVGLKLTGEVADAAARVAGLGLAKSTTTIAGVEAAAIGSALRAVASNVADLAALDGTVSVGSPAWCPGKTWAHLVALSTGLATASAATGRAVARDVAGLTAAVAGLGVLGALGAVTAFCCVSETPRETRRDCTHSCDPRLKTAASCQCDSSR